MGFGANKFWFFVEKLKFVRPKRHFFRTQRSGVRDSVKMYGKESFPLIIAMLKEFTMFYGCSLFKLHEVFRYKRIHYFIEITSKPIIFFLNKNQNNPENSKDKPKEIRKRS